MLKEKHLPFLFLLHATIQSLKWRVFQMGKHETCVWQTLTICYGRPSNTIHRFKNKWHRCGSVATTLQNNPPRQGGWPQMAWCSCFKALCSKCVRLSLLPEPEVLSSTALVGLVFTKSCLMGPKLTLGLNSEGKQTKQNKTKRKKREYCLCKMSRSLISIWPHISHYVRMDVWVQGAEEICERSHKGS